MVAVIFTTALFAFSCADNSGEAPDDVEFATLDKLVEVTGCVRSETDSGWSVSLDSGWGFDTGGYGDSGWGSDSGSSVDSGGSTGSDGDSGSASDSGGAEDDTDDGSASDSGVDEFAEERGGSQSTAPPKSRPCRPSERIDEVQTASCSDASSLRGGLLIAVWSLPFLVGRRRSS